MALLYCCHIEYFLLFSIHCDRVIDIINSNSTWIHV